MRRDAPLVGPGELAAHAGRLVRLKGRYRAEFDPAHKVVSRGEDGASRRAGCVAVLELQDGSFVELYSRPVDEGRRLDGRTVVATGEVSPPDPPFEAPDDRAELAQEEPMYSLVRIEAIEAAD
jgi:hypothetical protein